MLVRLVLFFGTLRCGEAANPGPVLGTFNPTGLLHKTHLVKDLPCSEEGHVKLCQELSLNDMPHRLHHGAYAEPLSTNRRAIGGKSTGVGVLTSLPARSLPGKLPAEPWVTGRIHAATVLCGQSWLKVGVAYGYPGDTYTKETMARTDKLLGCLTDRLVRQCHGLRMICGDFNHSKNSLRQFEEWRQAGWVEIQDYALAKWGQKIQATSKHKTVIDHVWFSPEVLELIESVHVDSTFFAGHSVLYAKIRMPSKADPVPIWRKPLTIPWDQVGDLDDKHVPDIATSDPEQCFRDVFQAMEVGVDNQLAAKGLSRLLPQQKGRCCTIAPTVRHNYAAPLRPSRPSEVQVEFLGEHFQYTQWCRQVRRLQSMCHLLRSNKPDLVGRRLSLWKSIRAAPGFPKGFPYAWRHRSTTGVGCPDTLPIEVPTATACNAIFHCFLADFRSLEKALIAARVDRAKHRRMDNPNISFKDVGKPRALPVATIVKTHKAEVTEVADGAKTVHYSPMSLSLDQPIHGPYGHIPTETHEAGVIHLPDDTALVPGDVIHQDVVVGKLSDVFGAFHELWSPMWNKHVDTAASHWTQVLSDILPVLPTPDVPFKCEAITVAEWRQTVTRRKATSAMGPDGVTRQDLLCMGPKLTSQLVRTINAIEAGELAWPHSTMVGLISSVEKHDQAQRVGDFRPITVLSQIYRTWASIRSRKFLAWIATFAPVELAGNRPNTSTKDVWHRLAQMLERCQIHHTPINGLVSDLTKCFNTIPRYVVSAIALHLGAPLPFVRSWHQAVTRLQRRFLVAGACGGPEFAATGYPEGCGLSVCSMSLINVGLHAWLGRLLPLGTVHSYVDNWEITTFDVNEVSLAKAYLKQFAESLDMRLDEAKTYAWSLQSEDRKALQRLHLPVKYSAKDLGGHVAYCRKHTMHTIRSRVQASSDVWSWLSRSHAPVFQKMRLLSNVVWPRCLHGVSAVWIGPDHAKRLRSAAMDAMGWKKKGASSLVQFGLGKTLAADPGFFALVTTIWDFRRHSDPDETCLLLDHILAQPGNRFTPGPCGALLNRLQELGWTWVGSGNLLDHERLPLHLYDSPVQLVLQRMQHGWTKLVGQLVSVRHTFQGIDNVDWDASHAKANDWTSEESGILRSTMNGTFYTRDAQKHMGHSPSTQCPFCDGQDSLLHRHWECPYFADLRSQLSSTILEQQHAWPECMRLRGWAVQSPDAVEFLRHLYRIPDTAGEFEQFAPPPGDVHIFTDGSCLAPVDGALRLATWATCIACLQTETFLPLSHGGVPGGLQTILRGEVCAAISALKAGLHYDRPFYVWTDNALVHRRICEWMKCSGQISRMAKDHDLWQQLHSLVRSAVARGLLQNAIKVRSHEDPSAYPELVERWAIQGNEMADSLAIAARKTLPAGVLRAWTHRADTHRVQRRVVGEFQTFLVKLGQRALNAEKSIRTADDDAWTVQLSKAPQVDLADLSCYPVRSLDHMPDKHTMGPALGPLHQWLSQMTCDTAEPIWVTSAHLLIHFQATTKQLGFCYLQHRNKWGLVDDEVQAHGFCFTKTANWFFAALRCMARYLQMDHHAQSRMPSGYCYRCWTQCLLLKMPAQDFAFIQQHMERRGATGIQSVRKAFRDWQSFIDVDLA